MLPFMERRTISALSTPIYKFVWPPVFLISPIWFVFGGFAKQVGNDQFFRDYALLFIFIFLFNAAIFGWLALKVKRVEVDAEHLYVSDYRKEVRIPLEEIVDVTEMRWVQPHWVTVHLTRPSDFGKKIVFVPPWRFGAFWTKNELVGDLKELARSKQPTGFIPPRPERRLFEDL